MDEDLELGLRQRKKIERRRGIEAAAVDLFERDGFGATTIEAIATRADIAPRTFFSYFATKEDVVLADYAERLDRLVHVLAQRPPDEAPWAALRAAFMDVADDYVVRRDELVRRFSIMADNPSVYARSLQLQAGWEDALAVVLAQRGRFLSGDVTPQLLASTALACMRSSLRHWQGTGRDGDLPSLVASCFDRLGDGLAGA